MRSTCRCYTFVGLASEVWLRDHAPATMAGVAFAMVAFALVVDALYDAPMRRLLTRLFRGRPTPRPRTMRPKSRAIRAIKTSVEAKAEAPRSSRAGAQQMVERHGAGAFGHGRRSTTPTGRAPARRTDRRKSG